MNSMEEKPLPNAEDIIERFGGIRPMANKMRVPVTTVQGWKKRNVIPGNRRDEIAEAAEANGIDVSDLLEKGAANENGAGSASSSSSSLSSSSSAAGTVHTETAQRAVEEPVTLSHRERTAEETHAPRSPRHDELMSQLSGFEKKVVTKSSWVTGILAVLALAIGAFLMWPTAQKVEEHGQRITALEGDVEKLEKDVSGMGGEEGSFLGGLIPSDLKAQIEGVREQAAQVRETVNEATRLAEEISGTVMDPDAGTLSERVERLELQMGALTGSPQFADLMARVDEFKSTVGGQEKIDETLAQLKTVVAGLEGRMEGLDQALIEAREENQAVGETFEGVSNEDLKAAAMLLGMTQLRESLNRGEAPFREDLDLLLNMVPEEDVELRASLERLAPHAEEGVLTPDGLSNEFRSLAGDIVVSSLKGEDVSVQEKARARINEVLMVEKNGEMVTGTETQMTVSKAEDMLEQGNIVGALTQLRSLDGEAALTAQPFIDKAEATLQAEQLKALIHQFMQVRMMGSGGAKYTTRSKGFSGLLPPKEVIRDPESGVVVMPPPGQGMPGQ